MPSLLKRNLLKSKPENKSREMKRKLLSLPPPPMEKCSKNMPGKLSKESNNSRESSPLEIPAVNVPKVKESASSMKKNG